MRFLLNYLKDTWEPLENLKGVLDLVDDYEEKNKFTKGFFFYHKSIIFL